MKKEEIEKRGICDETFTSCSKQNVQIVLDKDGNVTNKKYQVVFVDEYNNWWFIGFFDNLRDAEPEINSYLEGYKMEGDEDDEGLEPQFGDDAPLGKLEEYAGSFNSIFDRTIATDSGCVAVRGFIFN